MMFIIKNILINYQVLLVRRKTEMTRSVGKHSYCYKYERIFHFYAQVNATKLPVYLHKKKRRKLEHLFQNS